VTGRRRGVRDEAGGVALFAVACAGVLLLLGAALGMVAAVVVAHRQAQSAADLAALAGAGESGASCERATAVAAANGAELTACEVLGRDVLVTVQVAGPRWLGQDADLEGTARAGPAP
jgi:secretion/DNA translocation related TadE-like protein